MDRERLREGATRCLRERLDVTYLCVVSGSPQCIHRVPQRVGDLSGVYELAQQRVRQPRQDQLVGHAVVQAPLIRRPEELASPEEEGGAWSPRAATMS